MSNLSSKEKVLKKKITQYYKYLMKIIIDEEIYLNYVKMK